MIKSGNDDGRVKRQQKKNIKIFQMKAASLNKIV